MARDWEIIEDTADTTLKRLPLVRAGFIQGHLYLYEHFTDDDVAVTMVFVPGAMD
jgi:hypothetical protein